jgi:hypothetical protein
VNTEPLKWWKSLFPPRPDPVPTPRQEPVAAARKQLPPLTVPCAGGAFNFQVTMHERWARPGDPYPLETAIRDHADALRAQTERRLRGISRRYRPEDAEEFERAANAEVSKSWGFADDPGLSCVLSVHAAPDEELVKELRAVDIDRLKADAVRQRAAQDLEHLDAMRARWLAFLEKSGDDQLGALAVRLAGNPDKAAETIAKYMSDREEAVDEIRGACDTASRAYQDKGLYDFAMSMDGPLSRLVSYVNGEHEPRGEETSATT